MNTDKMIYYYELLPINSPNEAVIAVWISIFNTIYIAFNRHGFNGSEIEKGTSLAGATIKGAGHLW